MTNRDENARSVRSALPIVFVGLALTNLFVLIQANQLGLSQSRQPYDFYVLLWAGSTIFSEPAQLYVHQDPGTLGPYWSPWLWYGASYLYAPWFAVALSPLASVYPPIAKLVWAGLSYVLLVVSCAMTIRRVAATTAKFALPLLIFVMPLQILYTNQSLPQFWLRPQKAGMWISPVFFADFYWGNTNTMILALGLLAYCFALGAKSFTIGRFHVPSYVLSAMFVALATFKIMALAFVLPCWLAMNRNRLRKSIGWFLFFSLVLNSVVLYQPSLLIGYLSMLAAQDLNPSRSALWQVYEYVWYYTLPLSGLILLLCSKRNESASVTLPSC